MRIVHIITFKEVRKTEEELKKEGVEKLNPYMPGPYYYKKIYLKKPKIVVEMSVDELRIVDFYLELEKRKPILNLKALKKIERNPNSNENSKKDDH